MSVLRALAFTIRRSENVVEGSGYTTTKERVDGLLRLGPDTLLVQWRRARITETVGAAQYRTDRELDDVEEFAIPLSALAGAHLKRSWFRWPPGAYLHIIASDLRGFESVAGPQGLQLKHPAELIVRVASGDTDVAREFVGELELALAERALRAAEGDGALPERADRGPGEAATDPSA